jgi:oxygen-independent coproporphyrinogen-3 oxidase
MWHGAIRSLRVIPIPNHPCHENLRTLISPVGFAFRYPQVSAVHVYIHVPFCARKCSYCDFAIAVRRQVPSREFAALIIGEWRELAHRQPWATLGPIETIYFGGGTPSRLAPDAINQILAAIRSDHPVAGDAEITLEANPEDVTDQIAAAWRLAGINRLSLGVQSFDPVVLQWMHRTHGPDAPARAVPELRAAGFANISVDLIYAAPEHLARDWSGDLDQALALTPDHVSLYGLTVEQKTPLGRWVERGTAVPAGESRAADEYLAAHQRLRAAGFHHYEVSNAARPGFESRHNRAYWRRASYLGLGPSAHSAHGADRWWNHREWEEYRRARAEGLSAVAGGEVLSPAQVRLEEVYLALRTDTGLAASSLPVAEVDRWVSAGWASRVGSQAILAPEGWLRLDALVSRVAPA